MGATWKTDSKRRCVVSEKYDVGYASGVFDMFHVGHLNILRNAAARCQTLVVGVGTDEYVEKLKGRPPVVPFAERLEIVHSLQMVDEVMADHAEDKTLAWQARRFDAIFKGDDWKGTAKGARLEQDMASLSVEVVYFPYTLHTSSTLLRAHITGAQAS